MGNSSIKLDISPFLVLKIIGILLFVYFLFLIRDVLIILGISFILSAALEPVVDRMQKRDHSGNIGANMVGGVTTG